MKFRSSKSDRLVFWWGWACPLLGWCFFLWGCCWGGGLRLFCGLGWGSLGAFGFWLGGLFSVRGALVGVVFGGWRCGCIACGCWVSGLFFCFFFVVFSILFAWFCGLFFLSCGVLLGVRVLLGGSFFPCFFCPVFFFYG